VDWRPHSAKLPPSPHYEVTTIDKNDWHDQPLGHVDLEQDIFQNSDVVYWRTNVWYAVQIINNPLYQDKLIMLFGNLTEVKTLEWTWKLFGCLINYLFRPVPPVQTIINKLLVKIKAGFTLGLQLRFGGADVLWVDPQRHRFEELANFFRCAEDLLSFNLSNGQVKLLTPTQSNIKSADTWQYFIMSDSPSIKEKLKQEFNNRAITVDLPIEHIDRSSSFESYVTIAVEVWLLGETDFIISSRSHLGWFAGLRTVAKYGTYHSGSCYYDQGNTNSGLYNWTTPLYTYTK